jgi:hypothetical protein
MKLIPEARRAWRMASVQVAAAAICWGTMPTEWQSAILAALGVPAERMPAVFGLLFLLGRLLAQPKVRQ